MQVGDRVRIRESEVVSICLCSGEVFKGQVGFIDRKHDWADVFYVKTETGVGVFYGYELEPAPAYFVEEEEE